MKKSAKSAVIKRLEKKIIPILKQNGVAKAGIFGSYARGDYNKKSDVDILIEVKGRRFSLFDLAGLEQELEEKLDRKVDLVTYKSLYYLLRDRILREEIRIL